MRIIIPMAGIGKRMRPHTLTVPKPLLHFAGKPIVHHLIDDIVKVCGETIEEIAFIIGDFGKEVEKNLLTITDNLQTKGTIYYQKEALGTAHAILCAAESIKGKIVIAFADTLFKADFVLDSSQDGIIWVHKVADPRPFGVVKLNSRDQISDFIEKPQQFVSDLAIIGVYYFKDGENLRKELQYLIDNNVKDKGEYQITNALENMKNKGITFMPGKVSEWLDCGNKDATISAHQKYLQLKYNKKIIDPSVKLLNSICIEPVHISADCSIVNSVIGPYVSIGEKSQIENSIISNSVIQQNTRIQNANIINTMIGNHVEYKGVQSDLSLGDFNQIKG